MEIRLSCILLGAALLCGCSWFHRGHKAPTEIVAEEPQSEPSIIEPQVTRRVVKTPHIKAKDFELGGYYGVLSIQDFGTNPLYGVRAAYHRSTYLEDRAKLMQWWADYLDGRKTGKVLKMRQRAA